MNPLVRALLDAAPGFTTLNIGVRSSAAFHRRLLVF
jgi:hypothetical protein